MLVEGVASRRFAAVGYLILFSMIVLLSATGAVYFVSEVDAGSRFNPLPVALVLEVSFLVALFSIAKIADDFFVKILGTAVFVYILYGFVYVWMSGYDSGSYVDLAYIYKAFFYAALLLLVRPDAWAARDTIRIFNFIIVIFFVKYLIAKFIFDIRRPGVLTENNFELMLVLIPYAVFMLFSSAGLRRWHHLVIFVTVVVSGSLSSVVAYFVMMVYFMFASSRVGIVQKVIFLMAGFFSIYMTVVLKYGEYDSYHQVDRLIFLNIFISESDAFGFFDWVFGRPPLTPLSSASCMQLEYYSVLFSDEIYGNCYSVVMHSFHLRTIFDHGVFGWILLIYLVSVALYRAYNDIRVVILVLMISSVNGFSVSSYNSSLFAISALMVLASANGLRADGDGYRR